MRRAFEFLKRVFCPVAPQTPNSNTYDLLVTDLMFPDGVGTDLITIFERKQGCAKCILVTGSASELAPDKIPVLAGCFEKPLNADAFLAAVTKALA